MGLVYFFKSILSDVDYFINKNNFVKSIIFVKKLNYNIFIFRYLCGKLVLHRNQKGGKRLEYGF